MAETPRRPSPLRVENPAPKEAGPDNKRVPEVWHPKWTRDTSFGGRDTPSHGPGRAQPAKKTG